MEAGLQSGSSLWDHSEFLPIIVLPSLHGKEMVADPWNQDANGKTAQMLSLSSVPTARDVPRQQLLTVLCKLLKDGVYFIVNTI